MSGYPEEAPSTTRTAADADAAPDSWIERTFRLRAHHTDLGTEILAGVTTFVTLAYILFVNPNILKDTGSRSRRRSPLLVSPRHSQHS